MVDNWGTGLPDFTAAANISGSASISGNIVSISGDLSIKGNFIYRPLLLPITSASGGQTVGSGLTISGYSLYNVIVKNAEVKTSGTALYGFYLYSGNPAPIVWVGGGIAGDMPCPGSGNVTSGRGYMLIPGESRSFSVSLLERLYLAAETSGTIVSCVLEMK